MKITFYSNFLTHHQYPLCEALRATPGVDFRFVATEPMAEERLAMGYHDMALLPFVIRPYESDEQRDLAQRLCQESDIMIHGSAPNYYKKLRLESGRPLFCYSERLFRQGLLNAYSPRMLYRVWRSHGQYDARNVFLLCSSAYSAADFGRMGIYRRRTYKWGYFPEVKRYEAPIRLIEEKTPCTILWVARFLDWKHPELAIEVAKRLRADGLNFRLDMIGIGECQEQIAQMIRNEGLDGQVRLLGAMSPEDVRRYMEQSEIFLFTSDFGEGWGAVLNEAMNSCCAVVASHAIGAVPFLIDDGVNGLIYKNGDTDGLYSAVRSLMDDDLLRNKLQQNAYRTIIEQWSAAVAAQRLLVLAEELQKQGKCDRFESGPCSRADKLKNGWYRKKK